MIELLVALLIGMLGSLAIMQVFTTSEAGRRATGSLADTQSNALVGLFAIERDLQQAGMGLADLRVLGCAMQATVAPLSNLNNRLMVPAAIIPADTAAVSPDNVWAIPPGDAGSDILVIAYARAINMMEGTPLTRADSSSPYRLANVLGVGMGDSLLLAQSGVNCSMGQVAAVNQATEEVTIANTAGVAYTTSAYAFNLGTMPRLVAYAVRNGALTMCDFMQADCPAAGSVGDTSVWQPIVNDVVTLMAQYGWDTSMPADMTSDVFCKTRVTAGGACPGGDTGLPAAGNLALTQAQRACNWTRIPAIRVGLVMRSGQYEKEQVNPATLTLWPDSGTAPTTTGPVYTVPDRHYRYRVAYSTVALRNIIWLGAQSTC
jgi:type IV pilus assembly protein PilW